MVMTPSSTASNILILGAGSIGAVYLYQLLQAGCSVTAVCRSNYEAVSEHGFRLTSARYGNVTYRPTRTIQSVAECSDSTFDYILVCTKSFPEILSSIIETLMPVVKDHPSTAVVLAQNGIQIEDEFHQAFPDNPILSGVVYIPAAQTAPGRVDYSEMMNLLEIGTYPSNAPAPHKAAAKAFADLMVRGGGEAEVWEDIQIARWSKLLMNATWHPLCALALCTDGDFLLISEPFAREAVWAIMLEIIELAQAAGIPGINEEVARQKLSIAVKRSESGAGREVSMLQDVRQGRPVEVEAIVGNVVRMGRRYSVSMPRLETIYTVLKARNASLSKRSER